MGDSKTTRDQALRVARMLGCQGVYEDGKGWMPRVKNMRQSKKVKTNI